MGTYEDILKQYKIKNENRLFITIKNDFLDDMREGIKNVEYRKNTEFYRRKLFVKGNDGLPSRVMKPLKYILFQGGYEPDSPRLLIELKGWNVGEELFPKELDYTNHIIYPEAICLLLGKIIFDSQGGLLYRDLKKKKTVNTTKGKIRKSKKGNVKSIKVEKIAPKITSTGSKDIVSFTYVETKS